MIYKINLNKNIFLKQINKQRIPYVEKPILLNMHVMKELRRDIFINTDPLIAAEMEEYRQKIIQEKKKKQAQIEMEKQREEQRLEKERLKQKQIYFSNLLEKYKLKTKNYENGNINIFTNWQAKSYTELINLCSNLEEEVSRADMINNLYNQFAPGLKFYLPDDNDNNRNYNPYNLDIIKDLDIYLQNNSQYREELSRIVNLFIDNSIAIEKPLKYSQETIKKFFDESGKKIKEIFDLKNDTTNKWLERIPKLGLIPKILRVSEQKYLIKGLMKDYMEITNYCFKDGMNPLLNKYNSQLILINNFINERSKYITDEDKEYTEHCLNKIMETKSKRVDYYNKMLKNFTNGGLNINNLCKNIEKRGNIELVIKTLFTILPFVV